jgi:hypothetical protein
VGFRDQIVFPFFDRLIDCAKHLSEFRLLPASVDARQTIARLYFVDALECETAWRGRLAEQPAYFGITLDEAAAIAREAAAFLRKRLADTFTVWTRWRDALGQSTLGACSL